MPNVPSMDKYYYKFYSQDILDDWKQVLQTSSDSWMFHDIDLCLFFEKSRQSVNKSLVIYNSNANQPVAVCPLFLHKQHQTAFYRPDKILLESFQDSGPAIIDKLSGKKRREVIRYIGDIIITIMKKEQINRCRIASASLSEFCLDPSNSFTNPWHEMRNSWQNEPVPCYYIDLQKDEEYLKNNLETRARTIIHKFEKNGECSVQKAAIQDLDIIYDLFLETSRRSGLPSHQKDNFEWFLNNNYYQHYIAFINKKPACVIRLAKYSNTAVYAAGFTANDFVKTEIGTFALWECLLEMKKQGVNHFELGIEEFQAAGSKGDNIAKFKRSFGGTLRYKFYSVYDRSGKVKKVAKKILDLL
jgi:hypothetical protein